MSLQFTKLAYDSVDDFVYGQCKKPITCKNGMIIGGGIIYPEVNFTLPPMNATQATLPEAKRIYKEMVDGVLKKAHELHAPGVVIEFETLPQYTENPEWGIEIHKILRDTMYTYEAKYGLKSVLRMTPNDLREMSRPPIMRSGPYWDAMVRIFEQTAKDGADILAIESTGGKEINDDAIVNADLRTSVFALGCLGARDMKWLWQNITQIADTYGAISGGDSACGFANTSMVLAEQGFIPKVYAAVMRAMVTPRALVALENGAVGPGKDCAYENVYLKAITGTPISLEGKTAACAHFSPIGNIAASVADLWSNESIQQVKLLSGFAPVVSTEQLIYDCRLMNKATEKGYTKLLRDLLVESDCYLDPQAYILAPENVFEIAREIVKSQNPFIRTLNTGKKALEILQRGVDKKELHLDEREVDWIDRLRDQLDEIPEDEEAFIAEMKDEVDSDKYNIKEYGLE
ncbi:methanol--corrinoid methyltransferase [Sporanaerobium hydrogeniformans]|uniref:Methanol--corrinoid methyltransferase n=1 Tax=Sporanaerobium hydrogeniformans TaxID=3072179 RepID=A0AC61D9S7_9FIRM|nr:methyltransferase MtaB domain-containing protein [Sporanaerobium hydrogeniformans]PHV69605.1 methanol--corrinoid methyltransferase [Sporanaerobium hydrogeniformans]